MLGSRDVVEEGAQGGYRMGAHVSELHHQLRLELLVNERHGNGGGLVLKEVAIVRCLKLQLQVWRERRGKRAASLATLPPSYKHSPVPSLPSIVSH